MAVTTNQSVAGVSGFTAEETTQLQNEYAVTENVTIDVTRNSTNTATDADEVTLATLTIPGNILKIGSIIEVYALAENTNSASSKTYSIRLNGTSIGAHVNTTNQAVTFRLVIHVQDANTLVLLNNAIASGAGQSAGTLLRPAVTNVISNGFTVTITGKWGAAVAGEFIRLVQSKLRVSL